MKRLALCVALLALGCSDDHATQRDLAVADLTASADLAKLVDFAGVDLSGVDFTVAPDLAKSPTYPTGPYGNTVGAIIPPLAWEGYPDPLADAIATTKTYGPYTMNDLRLPGGKYGIVPVSSFS
jgi:hypothetical protein